MRLTEAQKEQLVGLLDWYFSTLPSATATVKAPVVSESTAPYIDLTDSDAPAPPSAEEHAVIMRARSQNQHPDASVAGHVPDGFVPTSVMNGRPPGGMKTDSAMVKRI